MSDFERGFMSEMRKTAFVAGFVDQLEKVALIPLIGLGVGALMGGATMGLAAMTKPKDQTWRGAGFKPSKVMEHMLSWSTAGIGGGVKGALVGAGLDAVNTGGKTPMAFRPTGISNSPISQLTKKVPGAF